MRVIVDMPRSSRAVSSFERVQGTDRSRGVENSCRKAQNVVRNSTARSDNFGIALYSRRPITSHRVEHLDDSNVPTIVATIDLDGRSLNVVGTHPLPPMGRRRSELRDRHLQAIGNLIKRLPPPVMVLGDLNTTSWSPHFRDLLEKCDLRDSRCGFGVQPTWPVEQWVLRIPIDHALVSEDLAVTQRYVGPDIGSDHFPIVVEFAFLDSP